MPALPVLSKGFSFWTDPKQREETIPSLQHLLRTTALKVWQQYADCCH